MAHTKQILTSDEMSRAISRMAHEIIEKNKDSGDLVLIGIRTGGALLAKRFQDQLEKLTSGKLPLGLLDITMYRDDLTEVGEQPDVKETKIDFDVNGKRVILIDDVLFTGRTIRCALDAIIDYGRPQSIQLAVLIDRGHRELPIKPDYIGKNIPTAKNEEVVVQFQERLGTDGVVVRGKEQK